MRRSAPGSASSHGRAVSARVALRVDADDLDAPARALDDDGLVPKQDRHLAEAVELRRPRERIPGDGDVVVAEDDERPLERAEQLARGGARRAGARRGLR